MTSQLADTLNLPHMEDVLSEDQENNENEVHPDVERISNMLQHSTGLQKSLSDPTGIQEHLDEMDEIYSQAMSAHKDMLDLAFNVEAKNSGQIFDPSTRMLELALSASKSKNEQRLKMMKLQIEREKLELAKGQNQPDGIIQEDGGVMSTRNAIMSQIKGKKD